MTRSPRSSSYIKNIQKQLSNDFSKIAGAWFKTITVIFLAKSDECGWTTQRGESPAWRWTGLSNPRKICPHRSSSEGTKCLNNSMSEWVSEYVCTFCVQSSPAASYETTGTTSSLIQKRSSSDCAEPERWRAKEKASFKCIVSVLSKGLSDLLVDLFIVGKPCSGINAFYR